VRGVLVSASEGVAERSVKDNARFALDSLNALSIVSLGLAVLCMWSAVPLSIRARQVKCLVWSKVDDKLLSS
jgi:hypothetical protein